MLEPLSIVCGIAVLLWTISDIFSTVFVIGDGAGHQSWRIADQTWRLALRFHDPESDRAHRRLRRVGPLIVLIVLVLWVAQLIVGWALVFVPGAFSSPAAVSIGDRIAFAGKSVVGRAGNSAALEASSGSWEAIHGLAGLSGVTMVSIGLAYVLPILAGVAHKRAIAVYIHSLGTSVDDIRRLTRTTGQGGQIDLHLIALAPMVAETAERHRAYPVLHFFHSTDRHAALAPAIAMLSLLLRNDVESDGVDVSVSGPLARTVHDLFGALAKMGLDGFARRSGLQIETDDIGEAAMKDNRWTLPPDEWLEAYVTFDGWSWEYVIDGDERESSDRSSDQS